MTKTEDFDVVRGSGNVFRDLGRPNPDLEQLKSLLATQIVKILDARELTVRAAHELTGFAAADFSRIRKANLARFTIDRLITILGRLDQKLDIRVRLSPASPSHRKPAHA